MIHRIELYVVRHGEREDEAILKQFYSKQRRQEQVRDRPKTDSLDPPLTEWGYRQSRESLHRLIDVLKTDISDNGRRKIAVFSSPLRRAVGTALGFGSLSVQSNNGEKVLDFPSVLREEENPDDVPITILNDLGNSAAAISKLGGMQVLVPEGFLRCASMDSNDATDASPFMRAVACMMPVQSRCDRTFCPNDRRSVRFWKCHHDDQTGDMEYSPLSKPIYPNLTHGEETLGDDGFVYPPKVRIRKSHARKEKQTKNQISAIDEAVSITAKRGCNVCVLVAHRETIRDLAALGCCYYGSLSMPYCCIGSFSASVEDENEGNLSPRVHYHFHHVSAKGFGDDLIPRCYPKLRYNTFTAEKNDSSSIMLLVPGNTPPERICTVRPRLSKGRLGAQIWLSSDTNFRVCSSLRNRSRSKGFFLQLDIVNGHEGWERVSGEGRLIKGCAGLQKSNGTSAILEVETTKVGVEPKSDYGTIELIVWKIL